MADALAARDVPATASGASRNPGLMRRRHPGLRSFRGKLILLVALAVIVPSALACLILGDQLNGQATGIFASKLNAQLETFSLLIEGAGSSLEAGVARTAADNTLQITLDLGIAAQLTRYLEQQRQVLQTDFLAAYQSDGRVAGFSVLPGQPGRERWHLAQSANVAGADCAVASQPLTIAVCDGVGYLVSALPIERRSEAGRGEAGRGDAAADTGSPQRLGLLLGGVRITGPGLLAALQQRQIAYPVIWADDWVVYANLPIQAPLFAGAAGASAQEYRVADHAYLGAAKTAIIGGRKLTYAVLAPLDPLRASLTRSVLTVAGFGLLLTVVTIVAVGFVARRVARPIEQLREGAAQIGGGDLTQRITVNTGDEFEGLAEQFNDMAGQLQRSYAELERKVQERTAELAHQQAVLRVTFDNMADGVVMFDEALQLAAWNKNFQEIVNLPDAFLAAPRNYGDYIKHLAKRGEFGAGADPERELHRLLVRSTEHYNFERTRSDGRVIEVRHNPMPDGGFVLIYSDITERKRSEQEIRAARDAAEAAYADLKAAQTNLVQAQKMAALGQLTAGIAHEIKNPLNFVNNFASLSSELLSELKDEVAPVVAALGTGKRQEIDETIDMLTGNLDKIVEHGKRADNIVKSMLEHSRGVSGERRAVDLNNLIEEALNLAYHGARAQNSTFNITLERDYAANLPPVELAPQEMMRVFLNLFGNGFYATNKQAQTNRDSYRPLLRIATRDTESAVEITVRDNGIGIPPDIRDKLFQPFFTTKPTGEGTGLGLSITYDIVTQQHSGTIEVDSEESVYTEFTIRLPRS